MALRPRLRSTVLVPLLLLILTVLPWVAWSSYGSYVELQEAVSENVRLGEIDGRLSLLDEILGLSARMASATGEPRWEARYHRFSEDLHKVFLAARQLREPRIATAIDRTEAANAELVALELRALALAREGLLDEARAILATQAYEAHKRRYGEEIDAALMQGRINTSATLAESRNRMLLSLGACFAALVLIGFLGVSLLRLERKAEAALARSNLAAIVDSSQDAILGEDLAGRISSWNAAAEVMFGYPAREVLGKSPSFLIAPGDRSVFVSSSERTRRGEMVPSFEVAALRRDRQPICVSVSASPVRDESGEVVAVSRIVRDVTLAKKSERAIRESEDRYRRLVEFSPQAIAVHAEGKLLYVNPAAVKLVGASNPDQPIGRPVLDLVHPDFRAAAAERIRRAVTGGVAQPPLEERLLRLDGTTIDVEITSIPTTYLGRPALQVIVSDISHRKRAEEELRHALRKAEESDRLKSAFLANISHEIRTPLNVILGYHSLLEEHFREAGDDSQTSLIVGVERAAERLIHTVHGIVDISRLESGTFPIEPKVVPLVPLVQKQIDAVGERAARKHLSLAFTAEEAGTTVLFDPDCLSRSLEQILDNAVKFTAEGGIEVTLGRGAEGDLSIAIRDTGVGIDESYQSRLFSPFSQEQSGSTRRFEGMGIGLALARRYLERGGAHLTVESRKNEGSVFTIRLPKSCEVPARPPEVARIAEPSGPVDRPAALVVEDDPLNQEYLRRVLAPEYEVFTASSPGEARALTKAHGQEIRIILMDISLGTDESGLDLVRSLRCEPEWRAVPIVATTAHAFPEDRRRALEAGCSAYLAKPIRSQQLLEEIRKQLA